MPQKHKRKFGVHGIMHVSDAVTYLGVSRATLYRFIKSRKVRAAKMAGKTVVDVDSMNKYLETTHELS